MIIVENPHLDLVSSTTLCISHANVWGWSAGLTSSRHNTVPSRPLSRLTLRFSRPIDLIGSLLGLCDRRYRSSMSRAGITSAYCHGNFAVRQSGVKTCMSAVVQCLVVGGILMGSQNKE